MEPRIQYAKTEDGRAYTFKKAKESAAVAS